MRCWVLMRSVGEPLGFSGVPNEWRFLIHSAYLNLKPLPVLAIGCSQWWINNPSSYSIVPLLSCISVAGTRLVVLVHVLCHRWFRNLNEGCWCVSAINCWCNAAPTGEALKCRNCMKHTCIYPRLRASYVSCWFEFALGSSLGLSEFAIDLGPWIFFANSESYWSMNWRSWFFKLRLSERRKISMYNVDLKGCGMGVTQEVVFVQGLRMLGLLSASTAASDFAEGFSEHFKGSTFLWSWRPVFRKLDWWRNGEPKTLTQRNA